MLALKCHSLQMPQTPCTHISLARTSRMALPKCSFPGAREGDQNRQGKQQEPLPEKSTILEQLSSRGKIQIGISIARLQSKAMTDMRHNR